ncbi:MAG: hypothetical protein FWE53_02695 [Firmicutes bacterium]|nr:hypothetical protein [Bacillota bacterium]
MQQYVNKPISIAGIIAFLFVLVATPFMAFFISNTLANPPSPSDGKDIWSGKIAASFASGTGTSGSPYIISSGEQLALLADVVNNNRADTVNGGSFNAKHYRLSADIYLNDLGNYNIWGEGYAPQNKWTPIGTSTNSFLGVFNGNNNAVFGIYINTTSMYQGLFGSVNGAALSYLGLEKSFIKASSFTGGFVGYMVSSSITNCYNSATVVGSSTAAGIAGFMNNTGNSISNSYNTGSITGETAAGIIGNANTSSSINNCFNTGIILGSAASGGVAGTTTGATITNSYNAGLISGGSGNHGGIVGTINNGTTIANCYNTGTISGGITGMTGRVGGIVGWANASSAQQTHILNTYNQGAVFSDANLTSVGGIAGYNESNSFIRNNYSSGMLTGINNRGGIAGYNNGVMDFCYFLTGTATNAHGAGATGGTNIRNFNTGGTLASGITVNGANRTTLNGSSTTGALNPWVSSNTPPAGITYSTWTGTPYPTLTSVATVASPVWNGTTIAGSFAGGNGSQATPYLISNGAELARLRQQVNNGAAGFNTNTVYYALTNNIYLNHTANWQNWATTAPANTWTPIGNQFENPFQANLDGRGFAVFGIYINSTNSESGLFGNIRNAKIENLGIERSYIQGTNRVAAIAGRSDGDVSNVSIVRNCYNTSTIVGVGEWAWTAGIVASAGRSTITNCYNAGLIQSTTNNGLAGGIVGFALVININDCYNVGTITATGTGNSIVGGIVADFAGTISIMSNCFNAGAISYNNASAGTKRGGGIVGHITGGDMINCYNTGTVTIVSTGTNHRGGVAGHNNGGTISNGYFQFVSGLNGIGSGTGTTTSFGTGGAITNVALLTSLNNWVTTANLSGGNYAFYENATTGSGILHRFTAPPPIGFAGGAGTQSNPYLISTKAQLEYLRILINNNVVDPTGGNYNSSAKYYALTASITLNNTSGWQSWGPTTTGLEQWTPIGGSASAHPFRANFDGRNNTVFGLYSSTTTDNEKGLFGRIEGAKVSNLGVKQGYVRVRDYVVAGFGGDAGGVIGQAANSTITNCHNGVNVYGNTVGGIVGSVLNVTIENCSNSGTISGGDTVGGIAGYAGNSTINNSYNIGVIAGMFYHAGGIAAYLNNSTVERCFNSGAVSGNLRVGGVAGVGDTSVIVRDCYNTGSVSGTDSVGGVIGRVFGATSIITRSYSAGSVTGTTQVGGLLGFRESAAITISFCYYNSTAFSGPQIGNVAGTTGALTMSHMLITGTLDMYMVNMGNAWVKRTNESDKSYYPELKVFATDL